MQKNSITNKITPCCGLPFSVIYWWVSNLTLNSESDRQFILSKISQGGVLSIDAWKVLINSGTLEADASLTKAEFLAWFDCGKQPTCEQLKLLIEAYKIGNWTPETELPQNIGLIDAVVNGQNFNGNVYTKEQVNQLLTTSFGGDLVVSDNPQPTSAKWYFAKESGTYPNAGGLVVDLSGKLVILNFDGTTWSKVEVAMPNVMPQVIENTKFEAGIIPISTVSMSSGYVNQSNGNVENHAAISATEFIFIPKTIERIELAGAYQQFALYDENKQYIATTFSGDGNLNFAKPSNAAYIRLSVENATKNGYSIIFHKNEVVEIYDTRKSNKRFYKSTDLTLTQDFYVSQINGNLEPAAGFWASNFISVIDKNVTVSESGTYQQFAFYDENKNFIATSFSAEGKKKFVVPNNAYFMRVTVHAGDLANYFIRFGSQRTTVGIGGEFETITGAVDAIGDGIVIDLMEGDYDEELKFHNKKVTIIGANKNKTRIVGKKGDYYKPAMEVSGEVYFQNLTFEETSENQVGTPAMAAYAVHLDYSGGGTMEFNNCIFKGNSHNTVGIGLHNNQTLRFINCEFHHQNTIGAGCMFAHNNPFPANGVNQKMEVINCQFYIYGGVNILTLNDAAWTFQDNNYVDNGTTFMFINNTFFSDLGEPTIALQPEPFGVGKITGNVKLHPASVGNSIDILNY